MRRKTPTRPAGASVTFLAMRDAKAIGKRVSDLLNEREPGKPRRLICKEAGISYKTLTDLLAGQTVPRYQTAEKLASYLGVTTGYIFNGDQEPADLSDAERLAAIEAQINELVQIVRGLSAQPPSEAGSSPPAPDETDRPR